MTAKEVTAPFGVRDLQMTYGFVGRASLLHSCERQEKKSLLKPQQLALARLELITRVTTMPGGACVVTLKNDQRLPVSRIQSRILREQLLRL